MEVAAAVESLSSKLNEAGPGQDDLVVDSDVEASSKRLRELLGEDGGGAARAIQQPERTGPPATLGDAILRQLESISSDYREHKLKVSEAVMDQAEGKPDSKSVFKMMALQMELAEHTVEVEIVGKMIGKFTGTVDQLTKL
ncbi:MAG: Type secretion basal body protein YscI, HrpB, PscI [Paucimonas sp.]|jgi:hypothetical protein|nr:Type secretion basal body protein YscI, HrpB, PscI [Paucimonas sp.]